MSCGMNYKGVLSWLYLGLLLQVTVAFAQQEIPNETDGNFVNDEHQESAESSAQYRGEGSIYLGFRLVEMEDSYRAAEYEEDESSLTVGIDGITCPLPHRYNIHGEYLSENNFYGDIGYAYRDILLFRNIVVGVHHNLGHDNYSEPGEPPDLLYEDHNLGDENYLNFLKNSLLLRVKAPDFPFHTFLKYRYVNKEGSLAERFMLGSIGSMIKKSQRREVDWDSEDLTLGMNSHLGPVEVEYAYSWGDFDPGDNNALYDIYTESSVFGRPSDTYPHNVVAETESYANLLKFHSSFTGQIVASASVSNGENKNNYSGAESDSWKAAFDLRWIPDPVISVFFKYRHREQDKENPDQIVLKGRANQVTYQVRPLISTRKDLFSLSARYRPFSKLTMIGNYDFEHLVRSDVDEWEVLPEKSDIHRVRMTAHVRPMKKVNLKAIYNYQHFENPSYNTEPDNLNKLRLSTSYTPATWLTALLDYSLTLSDRDELRYFNAEFGVLQDGERDGRTDHALGSLSFILSPTATVTASWAYNRWEVEQDLAYSQWNTIGTSRDLPYYDRGAPYTDESNTFAVSLFYQVRQDITLTADYTYTTAEGSYVSEVVLQDDSSSLASFSEMETNETVLSVELAKKILQDWEVGIMFQADFFDDEVSESEAENQDGELYLTTLTLKRYF